MQRITGFVLSALVLGACTGVIGSGKEFVEAREVPAFTRVATSAGIGVEVKVGEARSVVVSGDDNIVPHLKTEVVEGALEIGTEDAAALLPQKPMLVKVTIPALTALSASGGAKAKATGVDAQDFVAQASGGSEVTVAGAATDLVADASGGSRLLLQDLPAARAVLVASGGSRIKVKATVSVQADASGGSEIGVAGGAAICPTASGGSTIHPE